MEPAVGLATRYKNNPAKPTLGGGCEGVIAGGQTATPGYMVITCMDCCTDLHALFGLRCGEALAVQFAGPVIPAYDPDCNASQLFQEHLHLAIQDMGVTHLTLLGHTPCSTAKKLAENLYGGGDIPRLKKLSAKILQNAMILAGEGRTQDITEEIGRQIVIQGIKNLFDYPAVEKAIRCGRLTAEGLQIDRKAGALLKLNTDGNGFTFDAVTSGDQSSSSASGAPPPIAATARKEFA